MHKLTFQRETKAGWRFTWQGHKSYTAMGPVDVLVPKKCLLSGLKKEEMKKGRPVCSEAENKRFNSILRKHFQGRTHTIRRSSAQHMIFELNMRPEEVITITKHKSVATLEGYLAPH